ncbi:hypothetical protein [Microlunatus antarcticus]|uniref:Uncharacterized protein n=1 Tax=Microlunatus antarcticus TaxID=53388 RepID=A0A7W5JY42_9ACTN|nr:hypothetical protein [Microlunatus antarcticus]MBB3328454.1 hypothetical protein [Microlunatus antarcticus]
MSIRLDLPPERDLPAGRRLVIRSQLLQTTLPPRRRLRVRILAVVVPLAVLVLVLGFGLTRPWSSGVAVPASPPSTADGPTRGTGPALAIPSATPIDRGTLDASTRQQVAARCAESAGDLAVAEVLFARRTSIDGNVMIWTGRGGRTTLCTDSALAQISSTSSERHPLPRASTGRPVVRLFPPDPLASTGAGRDYTSAGTAYSVAPEVASLQMRLVVRGRPGAWFEASRSGDLAWSSARVDTAVPGSRIDSDLRVEDRAFDADGHELTIDRTPR